MNRLLILAVVIVLVVATGWYITNKELGMNTTLKNYSDTGTNISFDYPSDWNLSIEASTSSWIRYEFTAPDYSQNAVGKLLDVSVAKISSGQPISIVLPDCTGPQVAGSLLINGKERKRCDFGSGVYAYRMGFSENNYFFDISYNSSDPNNPDTKTIEAIIESFKFPS